MTLLCETLEDPKGTLEAWKGALESKELRVNVKKTKTIISCEDAGKITIRDKFPGTIWRKDVGSI